ncbi:MAG: serine hydrolase [Gammaproteobacteria bacterium]|nr:serine hydrolase [Gammaproteobacteria bacterium]
MPATYFPARGEWQPSEPVAAGFDADALAAAVAFAAEAETPWPVDLAAGLNSDPSTREPPPWNEVLGPTKPRGGPNGLVVRGGRVAASWGDVRRVDMTFSVTKSYLALLAGVALERGYIRSVDDPVREYALDDGFASAQNRDITWRHLLQQTSEWEGTLFDKPDLVDRNRQVGVGADNSRKGTHRDLRAPGSYWEYNDVRVNRMSLSLMQVFRRPLPEVLAETIMEPIGASDTWEWHPYRNSVVEIDGRAMASVPGGAHWGGGLFISSEDHARMGLLVCRKGLWEGRQVLPGRWIDALATPCPLNPEYGFLWWLNTGRAHFASAPESSIFALGAGQHVVWVDSELDLVVVARWIDNKQVDALIRKVMASLR